MNTHSKRQSFQPSEVATGVSANSRAPLALMPAVHVWLRLWLAVPQGGETEALKRLEDSFKDSKWVALVRPTVDNMMRRKPC